VSLPPLPRERARVGEREPDRLGVRHQLSPEPHEQRRLTAMHLGTPRHAAESLQVSAMFSD
jgi:hypothetical protein